MAANYQQKNMFASTGADLPLFSGTAPTAHDSTFTPQEPEPEQLSMLQNNDQSTVYYNQTNHTKGKNKMNAQEMIDRFDWDVIVHYMDDELREQVHMELDLPVSNLDFLTRYMELHRELYGSSYEIN